MSAGGPRTLDDVKGWFPLSDQLVMDFLLGEQERSGVTGDLLEMGTYLGKSTILIGLHHRPGERFVACDLFGQEPPGEENKRTAAPLYTGLLTREAFEANYLAFHRSLPEVVQAPTSALPEHVSEESCRFVHVDAAHLYDNVREDAGTARRVLNADGIVVFDDYRTAHTPGVPAALWPDVVAGDLRPICGTHQKLYGTWGDPRARQDALLSWLDAQGAKFSTQDVAGQRLVLVGDWPTGTVSPVPPTRPASPSERLRRRLGHVASEVLPPGLARAMRRKLGRAG